MSESEPDMLWSPSYVSTAASHIAAFVEWLGTERGLEFGDYADLWRWSVAQPASFWGAVREFFGVRLGAPAEQVLADAMMPGARWFLGAELNYAEHLLGADRDGTGLIAVHESGTAEDWSWHRLRGAVAAFASYLRSQGVGRGDRVVAFMPNAPEAVVTFLATASLGAIFAICGPEFATPSVAARFGPLEPSVLVATSEYVFAGRRHDRNREIEELRTALPSLRSTVIVGARSSAAGATGWDEATATPAELRFEPVPFDHPLWVLFSSGTTGTPKGIVHGHGGILLEHLKFLGLHVDIGVQDRFFWYTSTSWMVWTVLVSGLLHGATLVLYNGSPTHPGPDQLWRIAADQRVTVFGASAAYLHSCAKLDLAPSRDHDLAALRAVHVTGSPLSDKGFRWAHDRIGDDIPVFSSSGGTDVATAFVAGNPLLPVWSGEISGPCLGVNVQVWDEHGRRVVGQVGELVVASPMPSMPLFFWNDPDGTRYKHSYFDTFPGIWRHGDWMEQTERGSVIIYGRSDALLNRMGVRIGTAEIYQAVEAVDEVVEALAVGVEERDGGYWLPLFVVLRQHDALDDGLRQRIVGAIRSGASPRHVPDDIIEVEGIPHTLTGKKLEVPIKRILLGLPPAIDPDAIDKPELLAAFSKLARKADAPR